MCGREVSPMMLIIGWDADALRSAFACLLTSQGNLTSDLFHHRRKVVMNERRDAISRV